MRQYAPLQKLGPAKKRWAAWQRSQHAVVVKRAAGICEGCGRDSRPLQVAHLMGRRNLVAEPWASWAGLCAHLCSAHPSYGLGCHEQLDRRKNEALRDRLLVNAAERLSHVASGLRVQIHAQHPADVIRQLVRQYEAAGISPRGER